MAHFLEYEIDDGTVCYLNLDMIMEVSLEDHLVTLSDGSKRGDFLEDDWLTILKFLDYNMFV